MKKIHLLPADERELFFRAAASKMKLPYIIIEKDYWVVWMLNRLFSLDKIKSHLTFKGGTSLSKVHGIIERFSEDIDISIEKEFFGFGPPNDPENAPSRKKRSALLDSLSIACSEYVKDEMLRALKSIVATELQTSDQWEIVIDEDDPAAQTLLFKYPGTTIEAGYIRPLVKIEIGARSEHWPVSEHKVHSYVKEALPDNIEEPAIWVRALDAERTFWEKATILHQYAHLPKEKRLPPRLSRHFYDFFCLLGSKIGESALTKATLLEQVANHKNIYFASGWANYPSAKKGTLKLIPPTTILEELEKDYVLMQAMFFRDIPEWDSILNSIKSFEASFNEEDPQ